MIHKIGIITDIHGNDVAFKEVLKLLEGKCDEIICLGDMIGIGPNGNEVINIAKKLNNFHTVLGNHERYYLYGFNNPLSCTGNEHQNWIKSHIDESNREFIENIPVTIERKYHNKKIIFLHYSRRNFEELKFELIVKNAKYEDLEKLYNKYNDDIFVYGHEHLESNFKCKKWFINPGSLGCPFPNRNEGRYGIIEINDNDIIYTHYTFNYDTSKVVNDMFEKKMPKADFIAKNFYYCEKD